MQIVKKFFKGGDGFREYVRAVMGASAWRPQFCVLHNTGSPTLGQRPHGFTAQHMDNLRGYYEGLGWHSGPHLFVDDNGIWVFSPLDHHGTHTPSWNSISWGIEQLGDFESDAYTTGRGAKVRDNAVVALAAMCDVMGMDSHGIRFHHDDPRTTHRDCPGRHCQKPDVIERVHDLIVSWRQGEHSPTAKKPA